MTKSDPNNINNLGHPSTTPADRPRRPGWMERHQKYCEIARQGRAEIVFLGDSLTQRWEGAPAAWAKYLAPKHAVQMGIDNDGTQQVLWRIDHGTLDGLSPRVVVLLIGVNNIGNDQATPEEIRDGVAAILERLARKAPRAKVLLMGLLPYAYPGTNHGPMIRATNILLSQLADGARVHFLDIGPKLLIDGQVNPEIQHDLAHLTEKGYTIYAETIEPWLAKLMK